MLAEVPQPATIDEEAHRSKDLKTQCDLFSCKVPIVIELGPSLAEPLAAPEVSDEEPQPRLDMLFPLEM